jgi:hypothetical protein
MIAMAYPRHAIHRYGMTVVMRRWEIGRKSSRKLGRATDWDGAAQSAPNNEVDQRIS